MLTQEGIIYFSCCSIVVFGIAVLFSYWDGHRTGYGKGHKQGKVDYMPIPGMDYSTGYREGCNLYENRLLEKGMAHFVLNEKTGKIEFKIKEPEKQS